MKKELLFSRLLKLLGVWWLIDQVKLVLEVAIMFNLLSQGYEWANVYFGVAILSRLVGIFCIFFKVSFLQLILKGIFVVMMLELYIRYTIGGLSPAFIANVLFLGVLSLKSGRPAEVAG